MNRKEAFEALNHAKAVAFSKYGCSKGANRVFFDWIQCQETRMFKFTKRVVRFERRKNVSVGTAHNSSLTYKANKWVEVDSSENILIEGRGRDVLEFMQNYSEATL